MNQLPFEFTYGQLLLAAAAANLAAALLQLVLALLGVRRARRKSDQEKGAEVSLRIEVLPLPEGERALQPRGGELGTSAVLRICHTHNFRLSSECRNMGTET